MEICDLYQKKLESIDKKRDIIYGLGQIARIGCNIL